MLSLTKSRLSGKSLLKTLFFFLLLTQICFGQWYQQNPLITQNNLNDVTLINENIGWAIGAHGTVLKTTNGGVEWFAQSSGISYSLWAVSFIDENNGLAVGENGTVIKTINGGDEWTIQNSGIAYLLTDLCFISNDIAMAVGSNGTILKSTDSGATWNNQSSGINDDLRSICFINQNIGWTVGGNKILRTTNGGNTWSQNSLNAGLYGLHFVDANIGWVVGTSGYPHWYGSIFKTTNGGISWISQISGIEEDLNQVYFADVNNGWAVAGYFESGGTRDRAMGKILNTTNGGLTWVTQISGTSKGLRSLSFFNSEKGIVVGNCGTIKYTYTEGNLWLSPPGGTTNDLKSIFFGNENNGLVIGDAGLMLRTTDSGISWMQVVTGTSNDFAGMAFTDALNGWVVTRNNYYWGYDSCFALHTTDGGISWTKHLKGPLQYFDDICFIDANNGWIIGARTDSSWYSGYPLLLRTTNGGITWNEIPDFSIWYGEDKKIIFQDVQNGYLLEVASGSGGSNSHIYKTTNSGYSWTMIFDFNGYTNSIKFCNNNSGIAVGFNVYEPKIENATSSMLNIIGYIYRTVDGGDTWSSETYSNVKFNDIVYLDENNIVILAENSDGDIYYWSNDGGVTWTPKPSGIANEVKHLFFLDSQKGWAVGDNGTILHTTNGGVSFIDNEPTQPTAFILEQNYPNPFNPSTVISYQLPVSSNVTIKVYDILGNEITTLVNEYKPAGRYEVEFNAVSHSGNVRNLTSGVYFYQLRAVDYVAVKKMLLIK